MVIWGKHQHRTVLLASAALTLLSLLAGCKPANEAKGADSANAANTVRNDKVHAAPVKALVAGESLEKGVKRLQADGFVCEPFATAMPRPLMRCQRTKGEGAKACADSVWLEHDGQDKLVSVAPFNECE